VVLDPAHGGPDAGARGASGVLESDVALAIARAVRVELEREGLRVIQTRQGNENPSFDDRSSIVNGQRGAIFISLHVSSTGPVGSARVYSLPMAAASPAAEHAGLIEWDQAQRGYAAQSRRLAELTAIQLAQRFRGSVEVPIFAPVRQLRTVAAPAIAIELSSVSVPNADPFNSYAASVAQAVARAVADFRPLYEAGAK
jgi:N-acetylmuramoyl-L-alanine amidase